MFLKIGFPTVFHWDRRMHFWQHERKICRSKFKNIDKMINFFKKNNLKLSSWHVKISFEHTSQKRCSWFPVLVECWLFRQSKRHQNETHLDCSWEFKSPWPFWAWHVMSETPHCLNFFRYDRSDSSKGPNFSSTSKHLKLGLSGLLTFWQLQEYHLVENCLILRPELFFVRMFLKNFNENLNILSLQTKIYFCYLHLPVFPITSEPSIRKEFFVSFSQDSSRERTLYCLIFL